MIQSVADEAVEAIAVKGLEVEVKVKGVGTAAETTTTTAWNISLYMIIVRETTMTLSTIMKLRYVCQCRYEVDPVLTCI